MENPKNGKERRLANLRPPFEEGNQFAKGHGRPPSAFNRDLKVALKRTSPKTDDVYTAADYSRLRRWMLSASKKDIDTLMRNSDNIAIQALGRALISEINDGGYRLNLALQDRPKHQSQPTY